MSTKRNLEIVESEPDRVRVVVGEFRIGINQEGIVIFKVHEGEYIEDIFCEAWDKMAEPDEE